VAEAIQKGVLSTIPSAEEVLERAHILPTKKAGTLPIMARFYCKRDSSPHLQTEERICPPKKLLQQPEVRANETRQKTRCICQIYDDLMRANFSKM
jgi:hypothetical protein